MSSTCRPTRIAHAVAACCLGIAQVPAVAEGLSATAGPVNVIATTPLPGLGVDREHLPFPVPSVGAATLREAGGTAISETLSNRVPGVNVNEIQGNPWQADLNYRGFSASPLLGTAQGLSVYLDGVRVNEAFGDVVNWDLMPANALAGVDLVAGSNPAYGLNTLGGALALRTKSGFTHPGGEVELEAGAFGRRGLSAEYGRKFGESKEWAGFIAASATDEDGWRDHSPSHLRQVFAKLSRQDATRQVDLSILHADNDLTGNGLVPGSMHAARREAVFTVPDNTLHETTQVSLAGGIWLGDADRIESNVYVRDGKVRTLNGDANDGFEDDPGLDGAAGANGGLGFNQDTAVNNRTRTEQRAVGVAVQWTRVSEAAQTTVGAAWDRAKSNFRQSSELGVFDADRRPVGGGAETIENQLSGRTRTASVFVTGLWHLTPALHINASGRYNQTQVTMRDELNFVPPNLDGDHRYRKFNPALGAVWQFAPAISLYGGFNQGSRAPTPLELGCADPANPCTLPNALAADPFLEQVVTRTIEAGLRGGADERLKWRAGAFRSENRNDILFVGTSTSAGYFTNFGKTRRTGLEFALSGKSGIFSWDASANLLRAEFASSACLLAENNSSRGQDAACTGAGQDDEILVSPGDRIPGIPERSLKLAGRAQVSDRLQIGGELVAFSSQYVRGNENNRHEEGDATDVFGSTRTFEGEGTTPGYAVLNLRARYDIAPGWQVFARINNVFDKRYATGGALAENPFDSAGTFQTNADDWRRETFTAPGAPRAVWVGVNWRFAGR